jgi:5-methylthioadenosine/S-adenosylhomocysteine deaminase
MELCRVKEKWHGYEDGRIRVDVGIHSEYTSNHKLWEGLLGYASEEKLGFQLHLSQTSGEVESCMDRTGLTPSELLDCYRMFSLPTTAVGGGALTEEEKTLLGKRKISLVALPLSDAKNGQCSADILSCVKSGMNVALGTDGALECGNLDLFEVMRFTALHARQTAGDAAALPASAALMMATVCGARAQGRSQECGMLKEGMDADLALVDFSAPHLMPCHNVLSGLVFSGKGGDVAMTMVRGKILYQNGSFPTIDLKEVVEELTQYAIPKLFSDAKEAPHV